MVEVSTSIAFIAGVLSFFSPCVFPLLPGFLAYLAGLDVTEMQKKKGFNKVLFLNTLFYVLGFTLVFATIGLILTTVLQYSSLTLRSWLSRIGGIIIITFSLYLLGILKIPFLDREHAPHVRRRAGYTTSFLFGVAFAVGWTPCIGAVLGSIFTLGASQPEMAFVLLFAYAFGLAIPFLLVGTLYSTFSPYLRGITKYTRVASILLGLLLLALGLLLLFNRMSIFGFQTFFPV
jgi:cytochrome c-type biogenesis protein